MKRWNWSPGITEHQTQAIRFGSASKNPRARVAPMPVTMATAPLDMRVHVSDERFEAKYVKGDFW